MKISHMKIKCITHYVPKWELLNVSITTNIWEILSPKVVLANRKLKIALNREIKPQIIARNIMEGSDLT